MKILRWYIPVVAVVAALNLRPALLTLGPVLPAVQRSLALSPLSSGLLTALPILVLGCASAMAVPVGRRLGWNGGLACAMLLIGCGVLLRSGGTEVMLFSGAILLGIGIGLGNVFVPTIVKARLSARIGLAMGVYTMMLTCGALISVAFTPALFAYFNDWRPTLAVWAIPAFIAVIVTLPTLVDNIRPQAHIAGAGLYRNPVAWAVTGYMGLQSSLFYSTALWIGALMAARGMTLAGVAESLTIYYVTQFLAALFAPIVLTKSSRQDIVAVLAVAAGGVFILLILYGPLGYENVYCGLLGFALGAVFAVALTFQVLRARSADNTARLSSMAQFFGYVVASIGPLVLGLVSKWTDARLASAIWLMILVTATAACGWLAGKPRFVDDVAGVAPALAN